MNRDPRRRAIGAYRFCDAATIVTADKLGNLVRRSYCRRHHARATMPASEPWRNT